MKPNVSCISLLTDGEEDIVQKLSIRNRLGDRPTANVRSSIKSRLGPKVSSPDDVEDSELPEIHDRPKVRKIELSNESSNRSENRLGDVSHSEKRQSSDEETPVTTKPDDLRHKMKRKLKHSSKNGSDRDDGRSPEGNSSKRKVVKNNVWSEVLKERSSKGDERVSSSRRESSEKERREDKIEKRKEKRKSKDETVLEEKMKRMHEINAAIMEKHKQIQKEKELFDC